MRALELTSRIGETPLRILPTVIDAAAAGCDAVPALLSTASPPQADQYLTYGMLARRMRRYARWAIEQGLQPGQVVALAMPNRPDYLAIWLGLTSVGVVVALININLIGASLAHCLAIAEPVRLIAAAELADAVAAAAARLDGAPPMWIHGGAASERRIDILVEAYSGEPLTATEQRPVGLSDRALLIYTSGTTGMPKAAHVSHHRLMMWSHWFAGMLHAGPADRLYNCLPMYHSVGGVVATGAVLVSGGSVVLRERFSARQFWDDVARYDCSLFQYIGELCRYLLAAPASPAETAHRLRMICGNGLRPDIWMPFKERFRIPHILEFYAATEGNFSLYNAEGKPGAIGRIPAFLSHRFPAVLVKFDPETGAPVRDDAGLCIRCARDEVGEAIGKIGADGGSRFEGYTSAIDTEKKLLRDVFAPGDRWLRTGDLMRQDEKGFYYFVDRVGDTFRWKGENVATTEVAEAIMSCPGVRAATVYGVSVPGADGRAGMAAIVAEPDFDPVDFRQHVSLHLPDYARPVFLRLVEDLTVTETFKQKKQDLRREGYDPTGIADLLYVDDRASKTYRPLDGVLFGQIQGGAIRF